MPNIATEGLIAVTLDVSIQRIAVERLCPALPTRGVAPCEGWSYLVGLYRRMYAALALLRSRFFSSLPSAVPSGRAIVSDPPIEGMTAQTEAPTRLRKWHRSRVFFRVRVSILLAILASVLIWAGCDIQRRRARNHWTETLNVALILVRKGELDQRAVDMLPARTVALEKRLAGEFHRWNAGAPHPFHFVLKGPVDSGGPPPAPLSGSLFDLVRYTFELWQFTRGINAAVGVDASDFDATLYLVARPPKTVAEGSVEGTSQQGGTVGMVEAELDRTMVDFALFVTAHELFHLLDAKDKYDGSGRSLVPEGLAEPDLQPRYPQCYAEVMARNIALGPDRERPPESLSELHVGPTTAREIGWAP
jgi:hypothetical protein